MIAPSPAYAQRPSAAGVPVRPRANPLLQMDNVALAVATVLMALQLRGEALGELATLVALPIVALITFLADRRYLGTLLVLCIPSLGVLTDPQTAAGFAFPHVENRVVLAGVEVYASLVMVTVGFGRVCVELLRGGHALRGVFPRWLLPGFLAALVPAFLSALSGQASGMNQWSVGIRAMLALGGLFWGVLVARRARGRPMRLVHQLCTIITVGAALLLVGFLSDMFTFLLMGAVGGLLPYFTARRRLVEAGVLLGAALVGALTISLTTTAEVLVAMGCVMLAVVPNPAVRRWMLRTAVVGALAASALLLWLVRELAGKTLVEVVTRADGIVAFGTMKLLGDRGPLWLAAIEQITNGPYWIMPAGRPLRPENFNYGYLVYLWEFGAHNAVLELTRHVGLIAAAMGVLMMVYGVIAVARVLTETREGALRAVAAGVLGVAIPGITTGNFPIQDIGFFLWAVTGMVVTTHLMLRAPAPAVDEAEAAADEPPTHRTRAVAHA